jgi:anti-sigma factor RsiW
MDCEKFKNLMIPFLDGELRGPEDVEMWRHLEKCHSCREEKELLEKSWASLDAYVAPKLAGDFNARLMDKLHAAPAESKPVKEITPPTSRRLWQKPTSWAAAAALLITSLLAISLLNPKPDHDPQVAAVPDSTPKKFIETPRIAPPVLPQLKIAAADQVVIENLDILVNMDMLDNMELLEAIDDLETDIDTEIKPKTPNTLAYLYDFE